MKRELSLISILMVVLIMTTGCFGGDEESPPAEAPAAEQAPAAEATAVPPTPEPQPTVAEAPAAEESTEETSDAESDAEGATALAGEALAVENAADINSYRVHITLNVEEESGTQQVEINGEYVKEPPASHLTIVLNDGTETQQIETLNVNNTNYVVYENQWVEAPGSTVDIAELTLLTPASIVGILGQMELIGPEAVNNRPSTHYRADKDIIPVVGTEGDTMDVSEIADAQLDIWVDDEFHVINRLIFEGTQNATEPLLPFNLTYDYTDYNTPIDIAVPEGAVTADSLVPEGDAAPEGDVEPEGGTEPEGDTAPEGGVAPEADLGEMLGFDLAFPTGSEVDPFSGAGLYMINSPFTLEEAQTFIESQMLQNGYTQVNKDATTSGMVNYIFERDQKSVVITLSDTGDGKTSFSFLGGM